MINTWLFYCLFWKGAVKIGGFGNMWRISQEGNRTTFFEWESFTSSVIINNLSSSVWISEEHQPGCLFNVTEYWAEYWDTYWLLHYVVYRVSFRSRGESLRKKLTTSRYLLDAMDANVAKLSEVVSGELTDASDILELRRTKHETINPTSLRVRVKVKYVANWVSVAFQSHMKLQRLYVALKLLGMFAI
jgi:hypothetical protein